MAAQLARRPEAMLRALSTEELGITGSQSNPVQSAVAASVSTGLGAMIPVIPFVFTTGTEAIALAAVVSLIAHFFVGAAKSLVYATEAVGGGSRNDARGRGGWRHHLPGGAESPVLIANARLPT